MTDNVEQTVEHLAELQRQHQERSSRSQKLTNHVTGALGRPAAIALVVALVAAWVVGNLSASHLHVHALEDQPFPDLGLVLGFVAVVVALLILSTQRHSDGLAERRAELTLQIALLSERKVAKVIALLEEQRAENPLLSSRRDAEAEQMAVAADPGDAVDRIEAIHPKR